MLLIDGDKKPCMMCSTLYLVDIDAYICRECETIHSFFEARNYGASKIVDFIYRAINGSDEFIAANDKINDIVLLGRKGKRGVNK